MWLLHKQSFLRVTSIRYNKISVLPYIYITVYHALLQCSCVSQKDRSGSTNQARMRCHLLLESAMPKEIGMASHIIAGTGQHFCLITSRMVAAAASLVDRTCQSSVAAVAAAGSLCSSAAYHTEVAAVENMLAAGAAVVRRSHSAAVAETVAVAASLIASAVAEA